MSDSLPPGFEPVDVPNDDNLPPGFEPVVRPEAEQEPPEFVREAEQFEQDYPKTADEYGEFRLVPVVDTKGFEEQGRLERASRMAGIWDAVKDKDATREAGILALMRNAGVPEDIAENHYDELKAALLDPQFDPDKWIEQNPELWQVIEEDPRRAGLVLRDEKISGFAAYLRWMMALSDLSSAEARVEAEAPVVNPLTGKPMGGGKALEEAEADVARSKERVLEHQRAVDLPEWVSELGSEEVQAEDRRARELGPKKTLQRESSLTDGGAILGDAWKKARLGAERSKLGIYQRNLDIALRQAEESGDEAAIAQARRAAFENEKKILDIDNKMEVNQTYQVSGFGQLLVDAVQPIASQVDTLRAQGAGALAGAIGGAAVSLASRGSVPMGAAVKGGVQFGTMLGTFGQSYRLEAGDLYLQLREAKDDQGKRIKPEVASMVAMLGGLAKAGVELAELGIELDALGLGGLVSTSKPGKLLGKAMAGGSTRRLLIDLARRWLKHAPAEGAEEAAQTAIDFVAEWFAKSRSAGLLKEPGNNLAFESQDFSNPELAAQAGEAFRIGAIGGLVVGGAGLPVNAVRESLRMDQARRSRSRIESIHHLGKSEVVQQAPEDAARVVAITTARTGREVGSVWLDPVALDGLLTQQQDPDQAATELLGLDGPDRLRRAKMQGGGTTLEIPVADYFRRVASHPLADPIKNMMSDSEGTTTPMGLKLFQDEVDDLARELVAQAEQGEPEYSSPAEESYTKAIKEQLLAAGKSRREVRHGVAVWRAHIRTMLKRSPKAAEEVFRRAFVSIQRGTPEVLPDVVNALRERYKGLSEDDKARAYFLDRNTGLFNLQGMEAAPRPKDRPMLAEFSLEGAKLLNDVHGHDAYDGALRAMAQVLRAHGIEDGAKVGADIRVWVTSEKQAQDIAQAMSQAIDPRLQVTTAAVTLSAKSRTVQRGIQEVSGVHKRSKDTLFQSGQLGHRKLLPQAFSEGLPLDEIRGLADDDPRMEDALQKLAELPQVKQRVQEAGEALRPTVEKLLATPALEDTPITEQHMELFREQADMAFEGIHFDESGLLSEDGWHWARQLNPKEWVVSADLRGFREFNDAFGREGTDAINRYFGEAARILGAGDFDMAHPHGDEYVLQTDNKAIGERFLRDLEAEMANKVFYREGLHPKDGTPGYFVQQGLHFAHGIARSFSEADRTRLPESKERQGGVPKPRWYPDLATARAELQSRRVDRGAAEGDAAKSKGGRGLAREPGRDGASEWISVQRLHRARRAAKEARARGEVLAQSLSLLSNTAKDRLGRRLRDRNSLHVDAAANVAVAQILPPPQPPKWRSRSRAVEDIFEASFPKGLDSSPTEQADSQYLRWRDEDGPKPPPYPGGKEVDGLNRYLDLEGEDGITSLRHGIDAVLKKLKVNSWPEMEKAVVVLKEKVPALEDLRMPKEYTKYQAELDARQHAAEEEAAYWAAREGDEDISFDPDTLEQPGDDEGTPRGMVKMHRHAAKRTFDVLLADHSNPSTFLHESAHIYFELLHDIARHPEASEQVKADWQKILNWLGSDGRKITVAQKEQFARGFEAYVMEGKAPSSSLAEAFHAFFRWLTKIYRTIKGLDVELNDGMRQIFDRMLATDAELKRQQKIAGLDKSLWKTHTEAGMTPAKWESYLRHKAATLSNATMLASRKQKEARLRAAKAFQTEEFRELREEAKREWLRRPDVRAWRYLRMGEIVLGNGEVVKNSAIGKLDRSLVREMMGRRSKIERRLHGRLVKKLGEHPSTVADMLGWETDSPGRAMLEALENMPDENEWVQQRAEEKLKERHPKLDDDIESMEEDVQRSMHDNMTARWLLEELAAIGRRETGGDVDVQTPAAAAQQAARDIVENTPAGKIHLKTVLNRERSAANKAQAAIARGEYRQAREHKLQQILQHYIWRELDQADQDRDRFLAMAKKLKDRKRREILGRASKSLLHASDTLLEGLGLIELEEDAERIPLQAAVRELERDEGLAFDEKALLDLMRDPPGDWKSITIDQMRVVHRALAQMYTVARGRNTMVVEGRRHAIANLVEGIEADTEKRPDKGPPPQAGAPTRRWASFMANLKEPQEVLRRLGDTAYQALWTDGYIRSERREDELLREVGEFIVDVWEELPKEMQRRRYEKMDDLDGVRSPLVDVQPIQDRQSMWMVALNMGNASNRERLLGGYGWEESQVLEWLNRNMTREEWSFVESVWQLLDEKLYPAVAKAHEEANGLPPPKIQPTPIDTPFGTVRGGYFPARYDPNESQVGEAQARAALEGEYHANSARISVARSFTKERAKKYSDIIRLDWSVVPGHVMSVIHYAAFDRFVREARALMTHPGFRRVVQHKLSPEDYDGLVDPKAGWLAAVAGGMGDATPKSLRGVYSFLELGRATLVINAIGWSIRTATPGVIEALEAGFSRHGPRIRYLPGSYIRALDPLSGARKRALDLGREPRHRVENIRRNVRGAFEEIGEAGRRGKLIKVRDRVKDSAFWLFDIMDRFSTTIIWDASFRDAVAQGADEKTAAMRADDVVMSVMPVQDHTRMAAILRDKRLFRQLSVFYGYFSKRLNMAQATLDPALVELADAVGVKEHVRGVGGVAVATGLAFGMLALSNGVGEFIAGRGPEEDETFEEWLIRKMLAAPLILFPVVGEAGEAAVNQAVSGKQRPYNPRSAPALSAAERLYRLVDDALDSERGDMERVWSVLQFFGAITQTPLGSAQADRLMGAITEGSGDPARDVYLGPPRE